LSKTPFYFFYHNPQLLEAQVRCLTIDWLNWKSNCNQIQFNARIFQEHGIQSTLISPGWLPDQSWMNFSMENTPVRSSTLRPMSG
jgi:hypothetical protein